MPTNQNKKTGKPLDRLSQLTRWLESIEENTFTDLQAASEDASFRRYFRVFHRLEQRHYIVMDAPPGKEDCQPFIHITGLLRERGVNAPAIHARSLTQGFLLLDDLGSRPYLDALTTDTAPKLYADAIDALLKMQSIEAILPAYDERLLIEEMQLFESWYLNRHLQIRLTATQKAQLRQVCDRLVQNALEQPQVFVHRDYHSRNLMITDHNSPGVIDYQDAVTGPISYDLVSLFRDCYIRWPEPQIDDWLARYLSRLDRDYSITLPTLKQWFDLMGVQRHLKVLGIFCRLNYRDGKPRYLDDLPLVLDYVIGVCRRHEDLHPLLRILQQTAPDKALP